MRSALTGGLAPLVIDLRGGHVTVSQELLDLANIDAGIKEQCQRVTFMIKWRKTFISIWRTYRTSVPITTPLPLPQRWTTIPWSGMHA